MKNKKKETIVIVEAYVPGGIGIIKKMLQPIKEVQKVQSKKLLKLDAKNNYDVTKFGIALLENEKESVSLTISRVDGDKIFSVDLHLQSLT